MARGKGEGSVYKRASDGLWCVGVELPRGPGGKRRRRTIARKSKQEALAELRKLQAEMSAGRNTTSTPNVKEWFTYWITEIAPLSVRPTTLRGYRSATNQHIIPTLGRIKIDQITRADVRDLDKRITTTPKQAKLRLLDPEDLPPDTEYLAGSYSKSVFNVLRMGLNAAVAEGRITRNPIEKMDPPKAAVMDRKALTLSQSIDLLRHLSEREDGALWATYLLTGARRGEVAGLEVERVSNVIDLSWQLQRIPNIHDAARDYEYRHLRNRLYLTRPKSAAGWRVIPLVDPLASILRRHIGDRTEGLVFTDQNGDAWNPDRITEQWADLLAERGLPGDIVLHGLRHTAVDLLYAAGVSEPLIKEIVGHSTVDMTRRYRSKGNLEQLTKAMEDVAALFAAPPKAAISR